MWIEANRLATSSLSLSLYFSLSFSFSLYYVNLRNKNYLALLKVTSPKTEEPVTSSSNSSQHHILCALYFCRTSLRLGECAFFVPLHLGFIILIDVWTHTNKKAWRKIWIQAVPHFTSSLQVLSVKKNQFWNYEIPDS